MEAWECRHLITRPAGAGTRKAAPRTQPGREPQDNDYPRNSPRFYPRSWMVLTLAHAVGPTLPKSAARSGVASLRGFLYIDPALPLRPIGINWLVFSICSALNGHFLFRTDELPHMPVGTNLSTFLAGGAPSKQSFTGTPSKDIDYKAGRTWSHETYLILDH
ncbi:hypothetical protein PSHT_09967 [Puccinia striiformis]|uniref:Uncharacterized protein n=1 Tax=Puccinia striiformis TaxID=27350 RepID=A0A2S4VCV5_9BASI|nr:hypothetical protein PSHT_09967 [Puccinia striiformis]